MLLPKFNLFDAEQKVVAMVQPGSVQFFFEIKKCFFFVSEVLFVVVDFNIFKEDLV